MDLSGRWEFSFDRDLNGQLVPTSLSHEVIFIMLDEHNFVGRLVFPPDAGWWAGSSAADWGPAKGFEKININTSRGTNTS
jgi:hypothetical protein